MESMGLFRRPRMILLLLALAVVGAGLLVFYVFLPKDAFFMFERPGGGLVTIGRGSVQIDPPPDRYPADGFDHVGDYIARLLGPSNRFRTVGVTTDAGDRACSFWSRNGRVEVAIVVEWREEPE